MNRLKLETSPYLQQHKDNPVNWWPYSAEAFQQAKEEDKPVFISIGYSTCHWCHVMARESFSDQATAGFMNQHFINIKMDREEYPGIDKGYQEMYQMLNRRGGGWPLSVFANHDGSPFYIGTYFPKKASFGMPSFMDVNKRIIQAWSEEKDLLDSTATSLTRNLQAMSEQLIQNSTPISDSKYVDEITSLKTRFDVTYGGIGGAPKFPRITALRFLLQEGHMRNAKDLLSFVRFSFAKMAQGGLYDQIGGGFARYSVDRKWLVPHFEKMLYDNAGFIFLATDLYAITKDPFVEFIVKDTVAWLAREMRSPTGAFYSALNAESEGREGKYFVWYEKELEELLGSDFDVAKLRFGITKGGNFTDPHHDEIKGMNVLSIVKTIPEIAKELKVGENEVFDQLNSIRQIMFQFRSKRVPPSTDTKILTSWNAMVIQSLFKAAETFRFTQAGQLALNALDNVIEIMVREDKILRSYHEIIGEMELREIEGVLDDYSFLISALIQGFEYSDNWGYIKIANKVLMLTDAKFFDDQSNVYYLNQINNVNLMNRVVQVSDDSMQSGISVMVSNLFKLGKYNNDKTLVERGQQLAQRLMGRVSDFPGAMNSLLIHASLYLRYPTEVVILHGTEETNTAYFENFLPQRLIYRWNEANKNDGRPQWDVLENRLEFTSETVLICHGMSCSLPITTAEGVQRELNRKVKD